ncbi:NFX1-type zinc finger-containing protein 1 [Diplocarpon rosae]|nr:NFX1-type zinc finger-containing protein 1 [Diplocarpon rosae]
MTALGVNPAQCLARAAVPCPAPPRMTGYPATGDARRLFLASTSAPACAATFAPRATVNSALPSRIIESTSWKWRQTYNETDLSENSIVVLGCCHFFTTETLDGIIGMSEVYKIDENGEYTGLQSLVGTFHVDSETTINQALIDEMSNYFLVRGQERQQKLGKSIEKLHHKLDLNRQKIVADIQKAVIEYIGKLQHSKEDEISNFLKEAYAQASLIRTAMEHFRHNAAERNEPASKIHDTAVHASPEISLDAQLASMTLAPMYPIIPRDKRVNLDGHAAELKANYTHTATSGIKIPGDLPNQVSTGFIRHCKTFISGCNRENLPKLAVEATCSFGKIA